MLGSTACRVKTEQQAPLPLVRSATSSMSSVGSNATANLQAPPARGGNASRRAACAFRAGAMPRETLDPGDPIGAKIPIDHFAIVLQENRSFDHYFQGLPKFGHPDVTSRR